MRPALYFGVPAVGLLASSFLTSPASATSIPFQDPAAQGYLGICNPAGQQVTTGSTTTIPFAWRVVSSQAALKPYNNDYRTATLYAYQPINGLAPGSWSGEQLTSSSRYSNPAHPMAAATLGDMSLANFESDFPSHWNGLVELRLYLGTQNEPQYSYRYPALVIQVTGKTWRALDGGTVNCHSGTSTSLETIVLPPSTTTTAGSTTTTTVTHAIGSSSGSSSQWWWIVPGAALVATGGFLLRRRFRSNASEPAVSHESERQ